MSIESNPKDRREVLNKTREEYQQMELAVSAVEIGLPETVTEQEVQTTRENIQSKIGQIIKKLCTPEECMLIQLKMEAVQLGLADAATHLEIDEARSKMNTRIEEIRNKFYGRE